MFTERSPKLRIIACNEETVNVVLKAVAVVPQTIKARKTYALQILIKTQGFITPLFLYCFSSGIAAKFQDEHKGR